MASLYKRGRKYWGRVRRKGKELRQSLDTADRQVAEQRLAEWIEELGRVARGGRPRRLFDDAVTRFAKEHLSTLKPGAAKRYLYSLKQLAGSFTGKMLDEIGSAALADFETRRRENGVVRRYKRKGEVRRPVTAPAIRRDLACLSSMFGCAMEWEWIEANPVPAYLRSRRKRGLRESAGRTRYLDHAEERALLAAAERYSPYVAQAIAFAIETGLRLDEQFSLTREQIRGGRIHVEAATSKNSKARRVPLTERARAILAAIPTPIRSAFVFTNPETGTRFRNLEKGLKAAARRAKLKDVRWHDLRRTCGCRLLQDRGFSMEEVCEWLGHSSVAVTERSYAFLEVEHLERKLRASTEAGTPAAKAESAAAARDRARGKAPGA